MSSHPTVLLRYLLSVALVAAASRAHALPVELNDENGTRYNINTDVDPLITQSNASGALTDATYTKPVTVTSTFIGFTPFFFFFTTYTVQREVNIPLTNAFAGFNGLLVVAVNGQQLPAPLVFNPAEGLASEECLQGNKNRQLVFQTQALPSANLSLTRKVFVPNNSDFVRWLNVVTNTGPAPTQVGIMLRGLIGSGADTKINATSTGDSSLGATDTWFTTAESVPQGARSDEPRIGYLVQGEGATAGATSVGINSLGQAGFTYTPTIAPGQSAIIMTFVTVQGKAKQAKKTISDLAALPSKSLTCLSEQELRQVVNFAPITPPETTSAQIKLNFKKTGADTVNWKGNVTIGAGISLLGLPITVDVGGVTKSFVLKKNGSGNDGAGSKFNLQAKLKDGVTKAGNVKFSFNLKGDFQAALASFGLVDATVQNVSVSVPVSFKVNAGQFGKDQPFTYKATAGKSGTAKNS